MGEGGFYLGDGGGEGFAGVDFVADGKDVFFGGFEAVEAPVVHGEGIGVLEFDGAEGVAVADEGVYEFALGDAFVVGHDGGEAEVGGFEAVHGGSGFALFGAGAGGELGIASVCFDLFLGYAHGRIVAWR